MECKIFILRGIQSLSGKGPEQPDLSFSFLEQGVAPEDHQTLLPTSIIFWFNCCVQKKQGGICYIEF